MVRKRELGSQTQSIMVEMISWTGCRFLAGLSPLMLSAQDPKFWETISNWLSLNFITIPGLCPGQVKVMPHLLEDETRNCPSTKNIYKREEVILPTKIKVHQKALMDKRLQTLNRLDHFLFAHLFRILENKHLSFLLTIFILTDYFWINTGCEIGYVILFKWKFLKVWE